MAFNISFLKKELFFNTEDSFYNAQRNIIVQIVNIVH